jgi:tRNA(His) guanylyltransferase
MEKMKREQDRDTLGNRLKRLEALSTSRYLMSGTPVYARLDGKSFHTFCRGLEKPYSMQFISAMQEVTKRIVKDFSCLLGYVQSDEISVCWQDISKAPFEGRIQKLESVLASSASAYFNYEIFGTEKYPELRRRAEKYIPVFDCRVFNVPSMEELANAFLWRENDAIKNSINGMSLSFFSQKELDKKNCDEKVHMMRMKGYCFYEDTMESFMRGSFFRRRLVKKEISKSEIMKIPEKNRPEMYSDGKCYVMRSEIGKMNIPYRLTDIENKVGVLFNGEEAVLNKANPTFRIENFS